MPRVSVFTIRLMGPEDATDDENQEAHDAFSEHLNAIEDELSSEAPEGYYVKVDDV
jgi:hypothetical protein